MDQDFHYYGTYYAAKVGGNYTPEEATLIAKASNFIDFLSNGTYAGFWHIVSDTEKRSERDYQVVAKVEYPRYTFQGSISVGIERNTGRGLWASFHFPPGNYADPPNTPTKLEIHGKEVSDLLPNHQIREINPDSSLGEITSEVGQLLNRPLSGLSRTLIQDTINCLKDSGRLEAILLRAAGGEALLGQPNKSDIIKRFGLLLLGVRAHVIGDTWAHQDWCAIHNPINTYWDIGNSWFSWAKDKAWQDIEYQDIDQTWKQIKLSYGSHENLEAVPNGTSYVGHGWMGHLPDHSFVKYRYKPCWRQKGDSPLERDNPTEYKYAFLELCSLFSQASGSQFQPANAENQLAAAQRAISSPVELANKENCPRVHSAKRWQEEMNQIQVQAPVDLIDTKKEPDQKTVLNGQIDYDGTGLTRYGTFYINLTSDLYLFQIAADYHFQFVKHWVKTHKIGTQDLFADSWSDKFGPLSEQILEVLI